jgi:hypothetical protein
MKIYKYELQVAERQSVKMPLNAQILDIQMQHGKPTLWAKVDENSKTEMITIDTYGTGHSMSEDNSLEFLATVQDGGLVWHFFKWS